METWEWDGSTWQQSPDTTHVPPRSAFQAAYDTRRREIVIFGGGDLAGGSGMLGDTWVFDGVRWMRRVTPVAPGARCQGGMTYDPIRRTCMLTAGFRIDPPNWWIYLRDTWEWDGSSWRMLAPIRQPNAWGGQATASAVLGYSPERSRVVLAGRHCADTWELLRPCEDVGRGHAIGGPVMACTSEPVLGGRLELTYSTQLGLGALIASPRCNEVAVDVFAPLFCSRGSIYPDPSGSLLFGLAGNPARFSLPVPNDPDGLHLLGQSYCFQGLSVEATGCLRLTQGVRVLVSRPF
jgi:hypothetical protein